MHGDIAVSQPGKDGSNQTDKDLSSTTRMEDDWDQNGVLEIEKALDKFWGDNSTCEE